MAGKLHKRKTGFALVNKSSKFSDKEIESPMDGYFNLFRAIVEQSQNDILNLPVINSRGKAIQLNVRYLNDSIQFLKYVGTPDKVLDELWRHRFDGATIQSDE